MLQWKLFKSRWLAVGWLVFISILFFLPGSAIPKETWYSKIYLDKWIHLIFFAVLVFLWRSAFDMQPYFSSAVILFFALCFGIAVECLQEMYVPHRSFDVFDVVADLTGSIMGVYIWSVGEKNKPL